MTFNQVKLHHLLQCHRSVLTIDELIMAQKSSNETPEPLLRANEASKPWNITHHHHTKHPDEPEPGGLGLKSQRSSEPYDILHSGPLLKHPDFKTKVLMSTLSPRSIGRNNNIFSHSPAQRALNIITNGFIDSSAKEDAIEKEKKCGNLLKQGRPVVTNVAKSWMVQELCGQHGPPLQ